MMRSPMFQDESTNNEKTSTEMKLYEEGDYTDDTDELIDYEKAILGNQMLCVLNNRLSISKESYCHKIYFNVC